MITDAEYMQIVSEVYDLSDYNTKKKVLFCNEAQKVSNIEHIVGKLYDHIKENCDAIDFGSIPRSHGIITRIDNYQQLIDCISTIRSLVESYKEDPKIVDCISTSLSNIQNRERIFTKAFALNIEFPMMIYNTTVLSIVSGISLLITSSIEYIKNGHDSFTMAFDKASYVRTKDHVLYQYLEQFNATCKNGSLDKAMEECIKRNAVTESVECLDEISASQIKSAAQAVGRFAGVHRFSATIGAIALVFVAIRMLLISLRFLIYEIKHLRMTISDWFEVQATFLQINAENLKYRDDDNGDDHRRQVYQRQIKWVERLRNISNMIALKDMKARKEAEKEITEESRRQTYEDDENDSLF